MFSGYANPTGSNYNFPPGYIITNATNSPGNVTIYLPGTSSRMGAFFNVASLNPSTYGYNTAFYQFGSYSPTDTTNNQGRDDARGAYVTPGYWGGRAATIFNNGANTPLDTVNGQALTGAGDDARPSSRPQPPSAPNTAAFLSAISSTTVSPCACDLTQWGFWSANTDRSYDSNASQLRRLWQLSCCGWRAFL